MNNTKNLFLTCSIFYINVEQLLNVKNAFQNVKTSCFGNKIIGHPNIQELIHFFFNQNQNFLSFGINTKG